MNSGEYSPRQSRGEYSPMFTEPEANNYLSIIFRGELDQELQDNEVIDINTGAIVRWHERMES